MENKLLKNPQHVARLGYNPFTMHQIVDRTDTVGQITPCYYDFLQPGDKITASVKLQTRTQPLMAPAYCSVRECVDWFFVPVTQILQQFGNWYDNVRDEKSDFYSTLTTSNSPRNIPSFQVSAYIEYLFLNMMQDVIADGYIHYPGNYLDTLRLLDTLHVPIAAYVNEWNVTEADYSSNFGSTARESILFGAAYQKIYYDYFRLSDREGNVVESYNFDSLMAATSTPDAANNVVNSRLDKVFKLHYVPFKKDFFTNLFVSPVQGQSDISSYGVSLGQVNQWLSGLSKVSTGSPATSPSAAFLDGGQVSVQNTLPTTVRINAGTQNNVQAVSYLGMYNPPNIETMYAVQKLLEINRRSGKHFDAQTLAHYGINVPTGISGECLHLGHHEQKLVIGDVISTSNTFDLTAGEGSPLGELAGKGYSSGVQQSEVKFTAPYSGILMAVYYAVPDVVYSQHGLDKVHTYQTIADFPRPELNNLGMQPFFGYQSTINGSLQPDSVLGWQYEHTELKMKQNVAYGAVHQDGSLHYWALTRHEIVNNSLDSFLVPPTYLNDIMYYDFAYDDVCGQLKTVTGQSSTKWLELDYSRFYDSDPLIHHFEFNVIKASKMSTYGLLPL